MNEAEVRYNVLDPLLRELGYRGGADNGTYHHLESQLQTPFYHIGRASKKDFPIGRLDYLCGLKGRRGSFVVEAKSYDHDITDEDVGQAHSYAAHSSVAANLIVVCNGKELRIYETLSTQPFKPLLAVSCAEIEGRFHEIENFLGPKQLERLSAVRYEVGLKLSENLPPAIVVTGGRYDVKTCKLDIVSAVPGLTEAIKAMPQMAELENTRRLMLEFIFSIETGVVERRNEGRICADLKFSGVTKQSEMGLQALGMDKCEFFTDAEFFSHDPQSPTLFEADIARRVGKGSTLFPLIGNPTIAEHDMAVDAYFAARMSEAKGGFEGDYVALGNYRMDIQPLGPIDITMEIYGECSIRT